MEFFHILNRGVDKRNIVNDDSDRLRFVHSLFVFNDRNPLNENHRRKGEYLASTDRDPLVTLHAWCLMDNHYHLLVSPNKDISDISCFMKKLNMGYARYFNEKHGRSGYFWQGKYKRILVERDAHFMYIPYYIHLNPLDHTMKDWRTGSASDSTKAIENLNKYRWSSLLDYFGEINFRSLIDMRTLRPLLGDRQKQIYEIKRIISNQDLASQAEALEK